MLENISFEKVMMTKMLKGINLKRVKDSIKGRNEVWKVVEPNISKLAIERSILCFTLVGCGIRCETSLVVKS